MAETMLVAVGYTEQDDPTVCGNPDCGGDLDPADHVAMFTTRHDRRFCSVNCLVEAHDAYWARLVRESM